MAGYNVDINVRATAQLEGITNALKSMGSSGNITGLADTLGGMEKNLKQAGFSSRVVGKVMSEAFNTAKTGAINTTNAMKEGFFNQASWSMISSSGMRLANIGSQLTNMTSDLVRTRYETERFKASLQLVGASETEVEVLEDHAESLGAKFGYSKSQILDTMYFLKSGLANLNPEEMSMISEMAMGTAAATKSTVKEMNDFYVTATNIFGREFKGESLKQFALDTANQFTIVTQKSRITGSELNVGLSKIGASWKALGGALSQGQQMMAVGFLRDMGVSAEEAGTGMKRLGMDWVKSGKKLEAFGAPIADANGNARSMMDVIGDLGEKLKSLTPIAQAQALRNIFPNTLSGQVVQKMITNFGSLKEYMSALNNLQPDLMSTTAKKALTDISAIQNQTDSMKQSMLEAWGGAGEGIQRARLKTAGFFYQLSAGIARSGWGPFVMGISNGIGTISTTLGKGISAFAQLNKAYAGYQQFQQFMGLKSGAGIKETVSALFQQGKAMLGLGKAAETTGKGMSKAWGVVGIILGLLAAVIMSDKGAMKELSAMGKQLMEPFKQLGTQLMPVIKQLMASFMPMFKQIAVFAVNIVKLIMPFVKALLSICLDLIGTIIEPVMALLASIFPIVEVVMSLLNSIMTILVPVMDTLGSVLELITPALKPIVQLLLLPVAAAAEILKELFYNTPDFLLPYEAEASKYKAMAKDESLSAETRATAARKYIEHMQTMADSVYSDTAATQVERDRAVADVEAAKKEFNNLVSPTELNKLNEWKPTSTIQTNAKGENVAMSNPSWDIYQSNPQSILNPNNTIKKLTETATPKVKTPSTSTVNSGGVHITVQGNMDSKTGEYVAQQTSGLLDKNGKQIEQALSLRATTQMMRTQ